MTITTSPNNNFYQDQICSGCKTIYSILLPVEKLSFYEFKVPHNEIDYILSFYVSHNTRFALWTEPENDLLLELDFLPNITPFNAKDKLLTLLTYL
jgi:hypothetical protein